MLLLAHTSVGIEKASASRIEADRFRQRDKPASAKPVPFRPQSCITYFSLVFFFAPFKFLKLSKHLSNFLAERLRNVPRSRLLLCHTLHHALVHVSSSSLRDFQVSYQLYQSSIIDSSLCLTYFYSFIVNAL
jgi:hypothetical protein